MRLVYLITSIDCLCIHVAKVIINLRCGHMVCRGNWWRGRTGEQGENTAGAKVVVAVSESTQRVQIRRKDQNDKRCNP